MSNYFKTTVKELLTIFRDAARALIPYLEKAEIKWKDGEAYDDWDNIVTALYENIVCSSLFSEVSSEYLMPKYDFDNESYINTNYIKIISPDYVDRNIAFISFSSISEPLDSVYAAILDEHNIIIENVYLNFENLDFVFVKYLEGNKDILSDIRVLL